MTRRDVQFGWGDLETRLALVAQSDGAALEADAPSSAPAMRVFIHTGEVFASRAPVLAGTVLGSCVSVCLWDPETGIGGLNHFLLPDQASNGVSSPRYGPVAVRQLVSELIRLGAREGRLKAKVFGGASVLETIPADGAGLGVRNISVARHALAELGIAVTAEDTGGSRGRKVFFRTDDGSAWVRKL
ncbi:MAG: chemotaxis protein CheD [Gemmatimonadales bacterium]